MNPSYYELEDTANDSVNKFLSALVEDALKEVENSACVEIGEVRNLCYNGKWIVRFCTGSNCPAMLALNIGYSNMKVLLFMLYSW